MMLPLILWTLFAHGVSGVIVSPDTLRLEVGDTGLVACRPVNRYGAALADRCTWAIRSTTVASVRSSGQSAKVTAKIAGQSWAVGSVKGKRDSLLVIVGGATPLPDSTPPLPDSIPPKPPVDTAGLQAAQADSLVGTLGVQLHLLATGGVYGVHWADIVRPRLLELGVRHFRERMHNGGSPPSATVVSRWQELGAVGVKMTAGCWPVNGNYSNASHCLTYATLIGPGTIDAFDGWNEVDNRLPAGTNWTTPFKAWQQAMWTAYKGDPQWSDRWVLASSVASAGSAATLASEVGNLSAWADVGNMHSYPTSAGMPSNVSDAWIPNWTQVVGPKPLATTETGYHNCIPCSPTPGVSYLAQGKYLGRLPFEYFNRHLLRTSIYELMDESPDTVGSRENNWGLVRYDGTPKPSFVTLKNILALLADPGPSFVPGKLDVTLSGVQATTHQTLLQKRDGRFYLVLWQEVKVYDLSAKKDIANPGDAVTLTLPRPATFAVFRPSAGAGAIQTASGTSLNLIVPDEVIVVEVTR